MPPLSTANTDSWFATLLEKLRRHGASTTTVPCFRLCTVPPDMPTSPAVARLLQLASEHPDVFVSSPAEEEEEEEESEMSEKLAKQSLDAVVTSSASPCTLPPNSSFIPTTTTQPTTTPTTTQPTTTTTPPTTTTPTMAELLIAPFVRSIAPPVAFSVFLQRIDPSSYRIWDVFTTLYSHSLAYHPRIKGNEGVMPLAMDGSGVCALLVVAHGSNQQATLEQSATRVLQHMSPCSASTAPHSATPSHLSSPLPPTATAQALPSPSPSPTPPLPLLWAPSYRRIWCASLPESYHRETQLKNLPSRCLPLVRPGRDIVVLPSGHSLVQEWHAYCAATYGLSSDQLVFTAGNTGVLDTDMSDDVVSALLLIVASNPMDQFVLVPYTVTPRLLKWAAPLIARGVQVLGEASSWMAQYGSKAMLHRHVRALGTPSVLETVVGQGLIAVPCGYVCSTVDDLLLAYDLIAEHLLQRKQGLQSEASEETTTIAATTTTTTTTHLATTTTTATTANSAPTRVVIKPVLSAAGFGILFVSSKEALRAYQFPMGEVLLEEHLDLDVADDGVVLSPAFHYMGTRLLGSLEGEVARTTTLSPTTLSPTPTTTTTNSSSASSSSASSSGSGIDAPSRDGETSTMQPSEPFPSSPSLPSSSSSLSPPGGVMDQIIEGTGYRGWRLSRAPLYIQHIAAHWTQRIVDAIRPAGLGGFDYLISGNRPMIVDVNTGRFNGAHVPKLFRDMHAPHMQLYCWKSRPPALLTVQAYHRRLVEAHLAFQVGGACGGAAGSDHSGCYCREGVAILTYLRGLSGLFVALACNATRAEEMARAAQELLAVQLLH